jgi:hypothetical protein
MYCFHIFVRIAGVPNIKDTQCGFKLFTRKSASALFPNLHIERWAFDVELLYPIPFSAHEPLKVGFSDSICPSENRIVGFGSDYFEIIRMTYRWIV